MGSGRVDSNKLTASSTLLSNNENQRNDWLDATHPTACALSGEKALADQKLLSWACPLTGKWYIDLAY
jgi:hypothetical protein